MDLKNCIQVQGLKVRSAESRELYLGTGFNRQERMNLGYYTQVQGLIDRKDGSRELYLGTGFNRQEG